MTVHKATTKSSKVSKCKSIAAPKKRISLTIEVVAPAVALIPKKKTVRFQNKMNYKGSSEEDDKSLQSKVHRRRFLRRGSRSPIMLAIQAARSSAEYAQEVEWDDCSSSNGGCHSPRTNNNHSSAIEDCKLLLDTSTTAAPAVAEYPHVVGCRHTVRRHVGMLHAATASPATAQRNMIDNELAQSLFQKTKLTNAQKRRLSLEILSRVGQI